MNLNQLFIDKAGRVNANLASTRFHDAFMDAAISVVTDIGNRCRADVTIPDDIEDDIGLDYRYKPVLSAGIDWYLHLRSEWNVDNPVQLNNSYESEKSKAWSIYDQDNTIGRRDGVS